MFNKVLNFNTNRALNGQFPQMGEVLDGWEFPLTLIKIKQNIVEGDVATQEEKIDFLGVWQPLRDEQLQFLPEGQRSWSWYWIHAKSGTLNLQTGDKIIFQNKRFKVMNVKDYSLNGYIEYQIIEDFQDINEN